MTDILEKLLAFIETTLIAFACAIFLFGLITIVMLLDHMHMI